MKNRSLLIKSLCAQILCGVLLAFATVGLSSCHSDTYLAYKFPTYTFANRPIPPSLLANRVMIAVTTNGISSGSLQIVDAKRDIRSNIQNTKTSFSISGYASGYPNLIINYPAEITGFVYSNAQGDVQIINYGKESVTGAAGLVSRQIHRPRHPLQLRPYLLSRGEHRSTRRHRQQHRQELRTGSPECLPGRSQPG